MTEAPDPAAAGRAALDAEAVRGAKARDAALALPLIALAIFSPPLVRLFTGTGTIMGAPMVWVGLFGAWGALILCAALLSRRLARQADDQD